MKLNDPFKVEGLSDTQRRRLEAFEGLLVDRAVPMGLVATNDAARVRERHIADSLRGMACLGPASRVVIDMGSGAGLPGIPLAIGRPECAVTLVDRRAKAVGFLELAVQELGLENARVVQGPLEQLGVVADACLARALSPVDVAWGLARRLLAKDGFLVYWAGRGWSPADATTVLDRSRALEICAPPLFSWQGPLVIMKESLAPPTKERTDER